jgi:hypothetical protein
LGEQWEALHRRPGGRHLSIVPGPALRPGYLYQADDGTDFVVFAFEDAWLMGRGDERVPDPVTGQLTRYETIEAATYAVDMTLVAESVPDASLTVVTVRQPRRRRK